VNQMLSDKFGKIKLSNLKFRESLKNGLTILALT